MIGRWTILAVAAVALGWAVAGCDRVDEAKGNTMYEVRKTEDEWKEQLTAEQFEVLRQKGTEPPFKNKFHDHKAEGVYTCAGCGQKLFASKAKFDSGTGWPSYYEPIDPKALVKHDDSSWGMSRTEVVCGRCGGHLGHVFRDGPKPTGLRYCINSVSLEFVPADKGEKADKAGPE